MFKTVVSHLRKKNKHLIFIDSLRVILFQDAGLWCAQGIEIDYLACGKTPEETKANFERGLFETIKLNIARFGNIEKLLKFAPTNEWQNKGFSLVEQKPLSSEAPFKTVQYLQAA